MPLSQKRQRDRGFTLFSKHFLRRQASACGAGGCALRFWFAVLMLVSPVSPLSRKKPSAAIPTTTKQRSEPRDLTRRKSGGGGSNSNINLPIPEAGYGTATSLVCCRCGDLHSGRVPWLESSQCRTAHSRGSIDIPRRSRDFLETRICEQIAPGAISPYRGESAGKPDCGPKSCRLGCLHTGS